MSTEDLKEKLEFSQSLSNKELQDILKQYPDDAQVIIEYCYPKQMKYIKKDNLILIN
jgi:hypothetical protein